MAVYSGYAQMAGITLTAGSAGDVAEIPLDTNSLIRDGICRADRRDIRIAYTPPSGNPTEIARVLVDSETIHFRLQGAFNVGSYCVYYGKSAVSGDPLDSKAQVYPLYHDGDHLAGLAQAGTLAPFPFPKPGFVKHGKQSILKRGTAGVDGDSLNLRGECTMLYEDGIYHLFYDANDYTPEHPSQCVDGNHGWTTYLARSHDLHTWYKCSTADDLPGGPVNPNWADGIKGQVLKPSTTLIGSAIDNLTNSNSSVFRLVIDGVPTYAQQYIGSTSLGSGNIPGMPYKGHLALADNILGPWTKKGVLIQPTFGSYDQNCTSSIHLYVPDPENVSGSDTITMFYSTTSATSLRGSGLATMPVSALYTVGDGRAVTKIKECIPGSEQVENPKILFDAARGVYYQYLDHIGLVGSIENCFNQVMYWTTDLNNWPLTQKTSIIAGSPGSWDSGIVGTASSGVVRDGVVYVAYDGLSQTLLAASVDSGHNFREIGICDAIWPFRWGTGIQMSGSVETADLPYGSTKLTIRLQGYYQEFGVRIGGTLYSIRHLDAWTDMDTETDYPAGLYGFSSEDLTFRRTENQTKTFTFIRTETVLSAFCNGFPAGSINVPSGPATLYAGGNMVIEEISHVPATLAAVVGAATVPPAIPPRTKIVGIRGMKRTRWIR